MSCSSAWPSHTLQPSDVDEILALVPRPRVLAVRIQLGHDRTALHRAEPTASGRSLSAT